MKVVIPVKDTFPISNNKIQIESSTPTGFNWLHISQSDRGGEVACSGHFLWYKEFGVRLL